MDRLIHRFSELFAITLGTIRLDSSVLYRKSRFVLAAGALSMFLFGCADKPSNSPAANPLNGNCSAQEVGDAIYRHNNVLGVDEAHVAIFYRYTGGDPSDRNNLEVIESPGSPLKQRPVSIDKFEFFRDRQEYYGAYTASATGQLDYARRETILTTGKALTSSFIYWPRFSPYEVLTPRWINDLWDGSVADIEYLRCDGVVEYAYEANDVMVWGTGDDPTHEDITQPVTKGEYGPNGSQRNLWEHNHLILPVDENGDELTPNVQRGAFAPGHTQMHASVPEDPTAVRGLEATSHDADGRPNDPCNNYISIKWVDATDAQSGIWGYYVKVDDKGSTIPTWEDSPVVRVEVAHDDPRPLPTRPNYRPEWTSQPLNPGSYYLHIRSVDNGGNWGNISGAKNCTAHLGPLIIDSCSCLMNLVPGTTLTYFVQPENVYFALHVENPVSIGGYQAYPFKDDDGHGTYEVCDPDAGVLEVGGDWWTYPSDEYGIYVNVPPVPLIPSSFELGKTYVTNYRLEFDDGSQEDGHYEFTALRYETVRIPAGEFLNALCADNWMYSNGCGEPQTSWFVRGIGPVKMQSRNYPDSCIVLVDYSIPGQTHQQTDSFEPLVRKVGEGHRPATSNEALRRARSILLRH